MEPSLNNLTFSSEGLICDTAGSDYLGMWDEKMKFKKLWQGLIENIASVQTIALPGNRLLVSQFNSLYLIDLNDGSRVQVWQGAMTLEFIYLTNHYQPRLFGVSGGTFFAWKMKAIKGKGANDAIFNRLVFSSDEG